MPSSSAASLDSRMSDALWMQGHRAGRAATRAAALSLRATIQQERALTVSLRSCALRDWSGAVRAARPPLLTAAHNLVRWFEVVGELEGWAVWARWEGGRLSGDPRLLTHARLLVDLGTVFSNANPPARVPATLEGPPAAVMLTLARSCDQVTSVDFESAVTKEGQAG